MTISSLILVGASTGGPGRIYSILSALDNRFEGTIVIAQHMAASFIPSFIHQLQSVVPLPIESVEESVRLEKGKIYICSVTTQMYTQHQEVWLEPLGEEGYAYNPQIDVLFASAAKLPSSLRRLGIILTGIGEDGALGSLALYESGGGCLFESEASAIVYGMPRRAKELVCNGNVGSIEEIIDRVKEYGGTDV
jgi:two-component system chemotaxis response regulator CheB